MPPPLYSPALEGFGDLGQALLLSSQMVRKRREQEADRALAKQEKDAALAQALQFREEDKAERDTERVEQKRQFDVQEGRRTAEGVRDDAGAVGKFFLSDVLGVGKAPARQVGTTSPPRKRTQVIYRNGEPTLIDMDTGQPISMEPGTPVDADAPAPTVGFEATNIPGFRSEDLAGFSPAAQASAQRILASGDQTKISELLRRIALQRQGAPVASYSLPQALNGPPAQVRGPAPLSR